MSPLYVREDLRGLLGVDDPFARVAALQGVVFREIANRRTLSFELAGRRYFAKYHRGVGWPEICKNLLVLRPPVVSARNELLACRYLQGQCIRAPTVAAYAERGWNPARRESFVICDALDGFVSLEDLLSNPRTAPSAAGRRRLVMALAEFARRFHGAGVVHRDFYLCHLLLDTEAWRNGRVELAVLDLHRARIFPHLPDSWRCRDLAALLYSSLELPLTRRSWYRFVRVYTGRPLREVFEQDGRFWRAVERRARALYRKGLRKGLVTGVWQP